MAGGQLRQSARYDASSIKQTKSIRGSRSPPEPRGQSVAKTFTCQCGVVLRGETDDELVANTQRHAREVHDMEITREQILAMARSE